MINIANKGMGNSKIFFEFKHFFLKLFKNLIIFRMIFNRKQKLDPLPKSPI